MNVQQLREQFKDDTEFLKLCDRHQEVDLSVAALELARDDYPDLDFDHSLLWIDERAGEIREDIYSLNTPSSQVEYLGEILGHKHGLHGSTEAYRVADGSFLNCIIESGEGIPISLSVLYMVVARRAGIDLLGVASPAHFLTRLETIEGPLFLDAYTPGRYMNYDDCLDWIQAMADVSRRDARSGLKPVGHRTIVSRMLNNLKVLHIENEAWTQALRIQERLLLLNPGQYASRRDLALICLKAERPGAALALLQKILPTAPQNEKDVLRRQLSIASHDVTLWN